MGARAIVAAFAALLVASAVVQAEEIPPTARPEPVPARQPNKALVLVGGAAVGGVVGAAVGTGIAWGNDWDDWESTLAAGTAIGLAAGLTLGFMELARYPPGDVSPYPEEPIQLQPTSERNALLRGEARAPGPNGLPGSFMVLRKSGTF